jgi:hypothetical protein
MNSALDYSLVGLVLIGSLGYAVVSLGPRSLRRRLMARLGREADGKSQGSCGGCDDCGSAQEPAQKSPAADVTVPVSKIGRRT